MNIQKAYCIEMRDVVDIHQARNFYFSRNFRRELSFLCFDEDCRRRLSPKIIGVNYRKLVEQGDQILLRPHFREHHQYPHIPTCPDFEYELARREVEEETFLENSGGRDKIGSAKKSSIVNAFFPKASETSRSESSEDNNELIRIRRIKLRNERLQALKTYLRNERAEIRSGLLQEVVASFEFLSSSQRHNEVLRIGNTGKRYSEYFRHLSQYQYSGVQKDLILYGGAGVSRYQINGVTKGYILWFYDRIKNDSDYSAVQEDSSLTMFLSKSRLGKYKYGDFLQKQLEAAARTELEKTPGKKSKYVKCYFWGEIALAPKPNTLEAKVAHFDNLSLQVITKLNASG